MKLCINCKYFNYNYSGTAFIMPPGYENKCHHSSAFIRMDLVSGHIYREGCYSMRDSDSLCGKEGKLFESFNSSPPRTLLQRIFNLRQETKK